MGIFRKDVKLGIRYIVLGIFMYMSWNMMQTDWLLSVKEINNNVLSVLIGSVNVALMFMLKAHFDSKIEDDDVKNNT